MSNKVQYKLVLLGDSAVGKSSIVHRFVKDTFDDMRESTIGAAFLTQSITIGDTTVKFEIWDTAGQERYKSLAPMYYRNADAALVVYDVTQADSLDKAREWIAELESRTQGCIIALCGNKVDLDSVVSDADARGIGAQIFKQVSAKTGENISDLFEAIATQLLASAPPKEAAPRVELARPSTNDSTGCC